MSDAAMQLRNIARVLRKGFAGHLAFDSAECQGMAKSLATAADELDRAARILAALRAPSTKVLCAALAAFNNAPFPSHTPRLISALLAAVEATEQEVGRE